MLLLAVALRKFSAPTLLAGSISDKARTDAQRTYTEPPRASTQARRSVMSGSAESLTSSALTWRTRMTSLVQFNFGVNGAAITSFRSVATLADAAAAPLRRRPWPVCQSIGRVGVNF